MPDQKNSSNSAHDFGHVDPDGDYFEFEIAPAAACVLTSHVFTERGPRRKELAAVSARLWEPIALRVIRELTDEMDASERNAQNAPSLRPGLNRLSPMVGRELAVLLWALDEDDRAGSTEAILHGWRELAREERWWLFSKASMLGQRAGKGWRRAIFFALGDGHPEVRVAEDPDASVEPAQKKTPAKKRVTYPKPSKKKHAANKQPRPASKKQKSPSGVTKKKPAATKKQPEAPPKKKSPAIAKKKRAPRKKPALASPTR